MVSLNEYLDLIRPQTKGCPDAVLRKHVLIVLRDVCKQTNLYRYDDHRFALVNPINRYELDEPTCAEIATISDMKRENGTPIHNQQLPNYDTTGSVERWHHVGRNIIKVWPTPTKTELVSVDFTLMPTLSATEVDDDLFSQTYGWLHYGVLAAVKNMTGAEWFDPNSAQTNRLMYRDAIGDKRKQLIGGQTLADLRVQARRFI